MERRIFRLDHAVRFPQARGGLSRRTAGPSAGGLKAEPLAAAAAGDIR